jgi:hypothetical protein
LKKIIKKLNAPRDFWRPHNLNSYLCMQWWLWGRCWKCTNLVLYN